MSKADREYFKSPSGAEFITHLKSMIGTEHEAAENAKDKDASYAHMQRAKGIRETLKHVQYLSVKMKGETE